MVRRWHSCTILITEEKQHRRITYPPLSNTRPGKRQTLPYPTAAPTETKMKAVREGQTSRGFWLRFTFSTEFSLMLVRWRIVFRFKTMRSKRCSSAQNEFVSRNWHHGFSSAHHEFFDWISDVSFFNKHDVHEITYCFWAGSCKQSEIVLEK